MWILSSTWKRYTTWTKMEHQAARLVEKNSKWSVQNRQRREQRTARQNAKTVRPANVDRPVGQCIVLLLFLVLFPSFSSSWHRCELRSKRLPTCECATLVVKRFSRTNACPHFQTNKLRFCSRILKPRSWQDPREPNNSHGRSTCSMAQWIQSSRNRAIRNWESPPEETFRS